jgi:uncharacterized protein YbgA (DUF1722 family)
MNNTTTTTTTPFLARDLTQAREEEAAISRLIKQHNAAKATLEASRKTLARLEAQALRAETRAWKLREAAREYRCVMQADMRAEARLREETCAAIDARP